MSALEEMRGTGRPGPAAAALLYEVVAAVARRRRFPPPEGHRSWSKEALLEVAHAFLAHPRTPKRLATVTAAATDDQQLAALLHTAVVNYLRDEARKTDRAHLLSRIQDVLGAQRERFVRLPAEQLGEEHWAHLGAADRNPWQGRVEDLILAAWRASGLKLLEWDQSGRRGPIADRGSWTRFADAVLGEAASPVPTRVLADIAERRFRLLPRPKIVSLDEVYGPPPAIDDPVSDEAVLATVRDTWPQFTDQERIILAHHEADVRTLGELLGLGKSAAADARQRLMRRLRALVADHEDPDAVALALAEACRAWFRTSRGGSSSEQE